MARSSVWRTRARFVAVAAVVVVGFLALIGMVEDGVDRWQAAHGEGVHGTLTLEGSESHSVGRPPAIVVPIGTFESEDGTVTREVSLREGLGRPWEVGDQVSVLWSEDDPDRVFLEDTRAFRNWVEGIVFLVVGATVIGVIALVARRRTNRERATSSPLLEA